jgi:hypothetical protein
MTLARDRDRVKAAGEGDGDERKILREAGGKQGGGNKIN